MTIHIGTADHGHYYSFINTKRGEDANDESNADWVKTDKDPWKEFNDNVIKTFNFDNLKTECYGGSSNNFADDEVEAFWRNDTQSYGKSAYMLVYERKKKSPLREVQITSLQCADTAPSEPTSEEIIVEVPFKEVKPYMPEWIT